MEISEIEAAAYLIFGLAAILLCISAVCESRSLKDQLVGGSFLLSFFNLLTSVWVRRASLVALAPLRPRGNFAPEFHQRNRDIFVIVMLLSSCIAVFYCHRSQNTSADKVDHILAVIAMYRAMDLLVTIFRTGVFLNFRGDVVLNQEPLWRIRRVLLGVLMNYLELVMWYSVIYLHLGRANPTDFERPIERAHQALNLSMSTMTTTGYGLYSPNEMVPTLIALAQCFTGILLLATVVGDLIAMLPTDKDSMKANKVAASNTPLIGPAKEIIASWTVPIFASAPFVFAFYWILA